MDENNGEPKDGGKVESSNETEQNEVENSKSISLSKVGKDGKTEAISQSKVGKAESISQSKDRKVGKAESISQSKGRNIRKADKFQEPRQSPKINKKSRKYKSSGVAKLRGRFSTFGATMKNLWGVWGRFKMKNTPNPYPSVSEKTLGVPGFEEIACIEAEVPDIMMMDKDRVRTSCMECMKDPPAFPSKEQIKAKLIAADEYYGVKSLKTRREESDTTLEHQADYYDVDGRVVRPSWRFILERPLVEQYVLMTNYVRKVSVLSELREDKASANLIEEAGSGSDTEYKKFEETFIKEKRELLKPIKKPKTQDMAVQTSFEPEEDSREKFKRSVSEISLYPESEESEANSPGASVVTIVTSRDYSSPLQSDFDGRITDKSTSHRGSTTDRSTSYREGNWWESHGACQPSESFQTSYASINKNTSSGTDGQSIPIHSTWGKTALQAAQGEFLNESDSRIIPHSLGMEPAMHRKPKDIKVSFSPIVTYYQGPDKNAAVYNLPEDQDNIAIGAEQFKPQQQGTGKTPPGNQITGNPPENQITVNSPENPVSTVNPPENLLNKENPADKEEHPNSIDSKMPKQSNRRLRVGNILQVTKKDQIVSVSLPADWHENRILHNNQMINVAVSRPPGVNQPTKKIHFQEYEEIPELEYSAPKASTVQERTDANIQTQTPVAQKSMPTEKFKPIKHRESPPPKRPLDYETPWDPGQSKIHYVDDNPSTVQMPSIDSHVTPHKVEAKISNKRSESLPPKRPFDYYQTSQNPRQSRLQSVDNNPLTAQLNNLSNPVSPHRLETKIPDVESNHPGRIENGGKDSIGTETNIKSAPPRIMKARPRSESPKTEEQTFDGPGTRSKIQNRLSTSDAEVQLANVSNTNIHTSPVHTQGPLMETSPCIQPQIEDTNDTLSRNIKLRVNPSTHLDQKLINYTSRIPPSPPHFLRKSHSQQQQSTDTEGSSTSNEQLKLKASPACFFKVATPTDLSKISVDEFYPDVPEIDAELSQISETKTLSAPRVEIVFANKETALKYTQEAEFRKKTRKEENTILQKSVNVASGQLTSNASDKGRTIISSPGVGLKIDEVRIETSTSLEGKCKVRNALASKVKTSSQQSSITQNLGETSKVAQQSKRESEGEPSSIPQKTQTTICKTDPGSTALKQETLREGEVKETVKLKEVEQTEMLMAKDPNQTSAMMILDDLRNEKGMASNQQQKISTTEPKSNVATLPDIRFTGSSKKCEAIPSFKKTVHEKTETEGVKDESEKSGRVEKLEQLENDEDYDKIIKIQRQTESLPLDTENQLIPQGRTKLYMRTLSSLAEETSSVVETTSSSAQEKLIDMPVMARSVEELKTIFEKKPSMSGESEIQVEESCSNAKKYTGTSKEKLEADKAVENLASVETMTPIDDANKIPIDNPNSQGKRNLQPAAEVSNVKDTTREKSGTAEDEKPARSDSSSHCVTDKTKNPCALVQEESSVQQLSLIDVIRASEIYSNTSMYFSTSEDRVAKLNKARTVFQPVTMDDDLEGSPCSRGTARSANEKPGGPSKVEPGSLASKENNPGMLNSECQVSKNSKSKVQGLKLKTNHEGDHLLVGQDTHQTLEDTRQKLGKEKGEIGEQPTNEQGPSSMNTTHANIVRAHKDQPSDPFTKTKSKTDDTSNPSETKHWLMNVIPVLSKNSRLHGFRPHKPVCVKEEAEAKAVKFRQDAVKPVFRFLKRQRETEENKE